MCDDVCVCEGDGCVVYWCLKFVLCVVLCGVW